MSDPSAPDHLQRSLSNRHLQLIAIGGAIGTGLFMGSGKTISLAGPSILFVYLIIGAMLFFVMRAMGELLLSNLEYKSFIDFSTDLLGPWAGFFCGWTYWFCWIITAIADVIAIAAYAQFWFPGLAPWIPAILCVLLLLSLNLVTVRLFGEMEFWFALIKIIAICALILTGAGLVAWGFRSPSGNVASLSNLWNDGGMFPMGIGGFFAGFQIAVFAFVGIELVGTTAAETADPRRNLPKAINSIPVRILIFYVLALIAIMAVTPWRQVVADKSPFVELFVLAGVPAAASLINFVVLTSATSSANSGIFSTSRMLYGLAEEQHAPKGFAKLSRAAVPARGLLFSCLCLLLGAMLVYLIPNLVTAFTLVTTLSAVLFMFVWSLILCAYIAYRRKRPEQHAASAFKMPGGVLMCYVCLAFFAFVIVLLTLQADTRQALLASPVWFLLLAIGYGIKRLSEPKH
ncbi:D-serine/D-alanine/glycine transporter [Xanthomonas arboricola]|uniref:D-serine/D-alanine/glycine transporter n=1 Tax=Xanthomonas arboricola pv. corylina TaxID=487821 RepID=A0A8D6UPC8_9XANT|nr:D-serine/D-alanine/glycine transporter [Xanthomonas arboricola]PPU17405.1 D-serine/D-alanine/glycine transporter [Xanthomonas arboricola pv. corylina]WIX24150.1 D-serine/D-alanine/glycine transporter [Xanthomonas arboricola pv. corylina]CAE6696810.1 D-serine/D-alanine/glycine transporter [Xanthomonas arboricola pv. corylina]CAE6696834.1 D-serine/D-alanine/glycine transporter [Xanthomonas arboricola pv. corylina]CAE6712052.1 D-serine/D-alanine/glycine transporter [Xanthomonas arboricola pv. 